MLHQVYVSLYYIIPNHFLLINKDINNIAGPQTLDPMNNSLINNFPLKEIRNKNKRGNKFMKSLKRHMGSMKFLLFLFIRSKMQGTKQICPMCYGS